MLYALFATDPRGLGRRDNGQVRRPAFALLIYHLLGLRVIIALFYYCILLFERIVRRGCVTSSRVHFDKVYVVGLSQAKRFLLYTTAVWGDYYTTHPHAQLARRQDIIILNTTF